MMPKHSFRAPWARILSATVAASLLTVSACSSDSGGGAGGSSVVVVGIVTVPNNQTLTNLVPGDTRTLLGVPTNASDNWVDKPVTWISTNTARVSITAAGVITAVSGGSSYVKATAGGRTDSILVAVRFPVGTITVTPAAPTLAREGSRQMTATTLDTQGATVTGRTIVWASSATTIATVSATTGLVSASATNEGTSTISATAANASDGGTVVVGSTVATVAGAPVVNNILMGGASGFRGNTGTAQVTATARSGLGNTIATPITWGTNNASIGTVDAAGLVTLAGGTGALTITATATGAGAGGVNVSNTAVFEVARNLVNGVATAIPDMAGGSGFNMAFNATAGLASFAVNTSGGTGDGDLYVIAPGITTWTTTDGGGSNFVCRSWNSGNVESCPITAPAAGWWRIRTYAWTPAGQVSGMMLTLTHP